MDHEKEIWFNLYNMDFYVRPTDGRTLLHVHHLIKVVLYSAHFHLQKQKSSTPFFLVLRANGAHTLKICTQGRYFALLQAKSHLILVRKCLKMKKQEVELFWFWR